MPAANTVTVWPGDTAAEGSSSCAVGESVEFGFPSASGAPSEAGPAADCGTPPDDCATSALESSCVNRLGLASVTINGMGALSSPPRLTTAWAQPGSVSQGTWALIWPGDTKKSGAATELTRTSSGGSPSASGSGSPSASM